MNKLTERRITLREVNNDIVASTTHVQVKIMFTSDVRSLGLVQVQPCAVT